jgi:uncharacterized repeat protein (TIGR01451 family)
MKKFFAALKRSPKRTAAVAVVLATILAPAALLAWGPDRPTYTTASPADHVTFDSITDNPAYGDERNFVRIKDATADNSTYSDNVALQPGKEYTVYVYYHNNASSTFNDAAHNYSGIAKNVALRMEMPATVKAGQTAAINGYISASNATPGTVYDDAKATTTSDVALRYVTDSAVIHNFGASNGSKLANTMMTTGAPLGFDNLDGTLPGCNHYAGYVTFNIKVDQPNFQVTKQVSLAGQNAFSKSVTTNPGNKVDYKIKYLNTGTVQQDNVTIKDVLPAGVTYVPGSTFVSNSATNNQWSAVTSDDVTKGGLNIGSYAPGGAGYVKFTATVTGNDQLPMCGANTLVNSATANTQNGAKSDTANVVVTKTCQPGTINVCDLTTKQVVTINENQFDSSKYSKNLADCGVQPTSINVCNLATKQIVSIKESDFDSSKYSKNVSDCNSCTTMPAQNGSTNSNSNECVTTLPQTGMSTGIAAFIGLGTITAGLGYAFTSTRIRNLLVGLLTN